MKILHITPSDNGYEVVDLISNKIDKNNGFSLIKKDGVLFMSGGFKINDTPEIRAVLDAMPKDKQYEFIKSFKMDPWAKAYASEEDLPLEYNK